MALIVHITPNCENQARKHGLWADVERFRDRVESSQSLSLFDPFPPPYLVKKKLGGRQGRLIADLRPIGDHALIVLLAVLNRGSRDYEEEFARDARAYGDQHFGGLLSDSDAAVFVQERTRKSPPHIKPTPSAEEYELLYNAFAHHNDSAPEDIICETQEWIEQVTQDRIARQLVLLCRPCLNALSLDEGLHFVPAEGKPGWGIFALRRQGRLLLITPSTEGTAEASAELAQKTANRLEGGDASAILRSSRRAYPALILADDDLWIDLEQEPVANMALSPEETRVLERARSSESPFPLFINGRAGSGKSTILQYLFADLLFFCLSNLSNAAARKMAPPIYLTANGELLRVARKFVERLLRSEAIFTQQQANLDLGEERLILVNEAFREFQPFLLSLVPAVERSTRFAAASRVDYPRFRRLWFERFGKEKRALKDFGPDLSWHVIRSYIKGKSSETYLEPEDYAQLPENEISVTHDSFKLVFDRVWSGWYERVHEVDALWDDQDLTRYILDHDLAKPGYPAVFCDEAQDFTRLDLELLLRLNLFSNRSLPANDISRVPFAFAGDPFQTLNPTGFRWDAIKASFVEKFIHELDPTHRSGRTDLNYRELEYNYRSTRKIVRFGNHVQAMRAAMFQISELRPQAPWSTDRQSFPVAWFRANDARFWKKYRENAGFVSIVPCNEGEEAEFVQDDPVLRENVSTDGGIPLNVLSAARAKGCEYPAVIVYGFGSASPLDVMTTLDSDSNKTPDPDQTLPLQYFINRLYVAVSRAKRRLVIVDTDQGLARLWKCAQEEAAENLMLERIKNGRQIWADQVEGMTIGNPDDLTRESAGDPLENAQAFERDGIARQDAFLLRQAAQTYKSLGELPKYKECRARAFEAEGLYFDAGDAFFEAGLDGEGLSCLWRAGRKGWSRLVEKAAAAPQIQRELQFQWARGIVEKANMTGVEKILKRFAAGLDDEDFARECAGAQGWREALAALLQPVAETAAGDANVYSPYQVTVTLDRIRARGITLPARASASVYFLARRYAEAIQLWDEAGAVKPIEYQKAKAAVEPYPQRIISLAKLGLADEIVQAYMADRQRALMPDQAFAVLDALQANDQWEGASDLAWRTGLATRMLQLAALLSRKANDADAAAAALQAGLILLVRQQQWEPVASFALSGEFAPEKEWRESDLARLTGSQTEALRVTLVRALARSEGLPGAPPHVQRQMADFLRRYLRVKDGGWKAHIGVEEAGAAFERAGRFTEALGFYEAVIKENPSEEEARFARRRWLISKERQLRYETSQGATRRVAEIEAELRKELAGAGLASLSELSEFPELSPLERPGGPAKQVSAGRRRPTVVPAGQEQAIERSIDSPSDTFVIAAGPLKFELSRKNNRCNITHAETMETAFVKLGERKCGGEVDFIQLDDARWTCEPWRLTVGFSDDPGRTLAISLEELGVKVILSA